jgi:hypothetical protein
MKSDRASEDGSLFRLHCISRGSPRIDTEIKDGPDTGHSSNYFIRNLAAKTDGKEINKNGSAEKAQHTSTFQ